MSPLASCTNPWCATCANPAANGEARRLATEVGAVLARPRPEAEAYLALVERHRGADGARYLRDALSAALAARARLTTTGA